MTVTDIKIKVVPGPPPLLAYAAVTFDGSFVVHDLKVLEVPGKPAFVGMPSKQYRDFCNRCHGFNPVRQRYCGGCGVHLARGPDQGRERDRHADIAHPITDCFRKQLTEAVLAAYRLELERSQHPGYVCRYAEFARKQVG